MERLHGRSMTEAARGPLYGLIDTLILSNTRYLSVVISYQKGSAFSSNSFKKQKTLSNNKKDACILCNIVPDKKETKKLIIT